MNCRRTSTIYKSELLVLIVPFVVDKLCARAMPTSIDYRPCVSNPNPPNNGNYCVRMYNIWARQLGVGDHRVLR
jgi:hypothetical protein